MVQSNHATFEMASRLNSRKNWFVRIIRAIMNHPVETPSTVLVGVPDKSALEAVIERLQRHGIEYEAFYEPDYDLGLTAVATYPITNKKQRKKLSGYKLWTPMSQEAEDAAA